VIRTRVMVGLKSEPRSGDDAALSAATTSKTTGAAGRAAVSAASAFWVRRRFGAASGAVTAADVGATAPSAFRARRLGAAPGSAGMATGSATASGARADAAFRARRFGVATGVTSGALSDFRVWRRFGAAAGVVKATSVAAARSGARWPTDNRTFRVGRSSFNGVTTSGVLSPPVSRVRRAVRRRAVARSAFGGVSMSCMIEKMPPALTKKGRRSLHASCPPVRRSCFSDLVSYLSTSPKVYRDLLTSCAIRDS
jgi:hypothetical protein